jgi:hypothetical protein
MDAETLTYIYMFYLIIRQFRTLEGYITKHLSRSPLIRSKVITRKPEVDMEH